MFHQPISSLPSPTFPVLQEGGCCNHLHGVISFWWCPSVEHNGRDPVVRRKLDIFEFPVLLQCWQRTNSLMVLRLFPDLKIQAHYPTFNSYITVVSNFLHKVGKTLPRSNQDKSEKGTHQHVKGTGSLSSISNNSIWCRHLRKGMWERNEWEGKHSQWEVCGLDHKVPRVPHWRMRNLPNRLREDEQGEEIGKHQHSRKVGVRNVFIQEV